MSKATPITGASSGIGEATARRLGAEGHVVVLGPRRARTVASVSAFAPLIVDQVSAVEDLPRRLLLLSAKR